MSRTFWVVVGAAGGIYTYRKGTKLAADARDRGALGTVQAAASAAMQVANGTRQLIGLNEQQASPAEGAPVERREHPSRVARTASALAAAQAKREDSKGALKFIGRAKRRAVADVESADTVDLREGGNDTPTRPTVTPTVRVRDLAG